MLRICLSIILASLLLSSYASAAAGDPSPEEKQKQDEFKKAYNNPDKVERMKALQLLDSLVHATTVTMLGTVAGTDPDKDVKLEACRLLSKAPARDPAVSQVLANLFNNLKANDPEARLAMAKLVSNSAFKYFLVDALVDYGGNKIGYPNLLTVVSGVDPNVTIKKQRADFENFLAVFTNVTNASLPPVSRNTPTEIRKWWEQNRSKYMQADKELADKYKAEDQAKADKDKPK